MRCRSGAAPRRSAAIIEIQDYFTDQNQHAGAVELLNEQDVEFEEKLPRVLMEGRGGRRGRGEPAHHASTART